MFVNVTASPSRRQPQAISAAPQATSGSGMPKSSLRSVTRNCVLTGLVSSMSKLPSRTLSGSAQKLG